MADKFITVEEAAFRLRLGSEDVLGMIRSGRLLGVQIDGTLRVQACDVVALLSAGMSGSQSGPSPLTTSELIRAAVGELRVPCVNLHEYEVDSEVLKLVPRTLCEKHRFIPVSCTGSTLIVAMADPGDAPAREEVRVLTGLKVEPVVASASEIESAIERYYPR